jgi:putative transposase
MTELDIGKYRNKYRIKSTRLMHWDYAKDGSYFVTICTSEKEYLFGDVINEEMRLSELGKIVKTELLKTAEMRKNIILDKWVIMPNHIHIIFNVENDSCGYPDSQMSTEYQNKFGPQKNNLSSVIRGFKSSVTKVSKDLKYCDCIWQERFYDHLIRNQSELDRVRQYIINNPLKWEIDRNNPENIYM